MKKNIIKRFEIAIVMGLVISIIASFCNFNVQCRQIRSDVLRLHIKANSNSAADQALKLKVRDRVVLAAAGVFDGAGNLKQAESKIAADLAYLQSIAADEIAKDGYSYPVTLTLAPTFFDTRVYSDITMPAGVYESLNIDIGTGKGHNWWCVIFPPMCLPAADEQRQLSTVMSSNDVDAVKNYQKYQFKFKSVELYEQFLQWVHHTKTESEQ